MRHSIAQFIGKGAVVLQQFEQLQHGAILVAFKKRFYLHIGMNVSSFYRSPYIPLSLANTEGVIQLSLVKDYELLADLGDALGLLWSDKKNQLLDNLKIRNNSILAHGIDPIGDREIEICKAVLDSFIEDGLSCCGIKCDWSQLPGVELLDL